MQFSIRLYALAAGLVAAGALVFGGSAALAQDSDTFDVSVTTNAAVEIACGDNLEFGNLYVAADNTQTDVAMGTGGTLTPTSGDVGVLSSGQPAACTISGLDGTDTANITLAGGGGTPATGGLDDVTLDGTAARTLTLTQLRILGGNQITGGREGLGNGAVEIVGTVRIPADHANDPANLETYSVTITATVALD